LLARDAEYLNVSTANLTSEPPNIVNRIYAYFETTISKIHFEKFFKKKRNDKAKSTETTEEDIDLNRL
jgi:hypothetical protein